MRAYFFLAVACLLAPLWWILGRGLTWLIMMSGADVRRDRAKLEALRRER